MPAETTRQRAASDVLAGTGRPVLWPVLLLAAAGIAVYVNSFGVPFVFDDHGSILENPHIRQLWPLSQALGAPVQSAFAGRPIASLSLALNYAVGGLNPAGFHAWNLGVHLLCGVVLFGIIRRTLDSRRLSPRFGAAATRVAFACVLAWLLHPLQTEVVDYVTQRTESMMALFYLLTLYASIRVMSAKEGPTARWQAVAILACGLGALTKESIATAPVMVLLYDAVFQAGSFKEALSARRRLYAGLATTWIVLAVIVSAGPRWRSAGLSSGVSPWTYLLNQPEMIVTYLRLAVWPVGQVFDYGIPRTLALREVLPYGLVVLSLLAATALAWRRRPELAFLGAWFFITLAPSSSIVPIATEVGAERRMYLPLVAVIVFLVAGARWLLALSGIRDQGSGIRDQGAGIRDRTAQLQGRVPAVCLMAICGLLALMTVRRNAEYATEAGIWQTVVDRRPQGRAHYNLGLELNEIGRREEALRHYRLALPDTPAAHYAIGFELDAEGKHEEAIQHYREFIRLRPDDINVVRAYVVLGRALKTENQLEPAAEAFRQALQRQSTNVEARAGLADVLLKTERYDEAIQAYREYVRLKPDDAAAHSGLGIALVGRNLEAEAVAEFARAVELEPNDSAKQYNLGNALASTGRLDEAVIHYERGLALAPTSVPIHNALALVLAAQGQSAEALAHFQRSMALDPTNEQTRKDFAAAFPRGPSPGLTPQHAR